MTLLFPISPENGIFRPFPEASQLKGKEQTRITSLASNTLISFIFPPSPWDEDPGFGITLGFLQLLQGTEGLEYFTRQLSTEWNLPLIFTFDEFPYLSLIPDFKATLVLIHSHLKLNTHFHILLFGEGRVESLRREENSSEFLFFLPKIPATILEAAVPVSPSCHQVQGGGDCHNVT